MTLDKTSPLYADLRSLSGKYGVALLIEFMNYVFIGWFIYMICTAIIGVFGIELKTDTGAGYLVFLLINDLAAYLVPALAAYAIFSKDIKETDRMLSLAGDEMRYPRVTGSVVLLFLAGLFMASAGAIGTSAVSEFLNRLFGVPEPQTAFSDNMPMGIAEFIIFETSTTIIAPVCEELIYRHLLLKPFRKYSDLTAALISSLIFAVAHFNFDQFLYTFFFGFALALIAVRSNSVIPSIICHIANNFIAGITVYMPEEFGDSVLNAFFGAVGTVFSVISELTFWAGIPALVLAMLLKLHEFKSASFVPVRDQLRVLLTHPVVILSLVGSLFLTFLLLYS